MKAETIPSCVKSVDLQTTRRHIPEYEQVRRHRHKALVWTVLRPWGNIALFKPVVLGRFQFVEHPEIVGLLSAERHEHPIFVRDLSA